MPTRIFSGLYRLVDKGWGGRKALRLFFQDLGRDAEPFCIPVWFDYDYKPYRGAGPSFKTDVGIGDVLMIEVGVSKNKNPVLMSAYKVDGYSIPEDQVSSLVRPTRPPSLIRRNPKLDAAVYKAPSEQQLHYLVNLYEGDVIYEVCVNGIVDEHPYNLLCDMIFNAEDQAERLGSERYLLTVKIWSSYHAESNDPPSIIEYVRTQYIQAFPELATQDFAYVRRSLNGNNRFTLCWCLIKGDKSIKLDGIRGVTDSIYDDSLMTEE